MFTKGPVWFHVHVFKCSNGRKKYCKNVKSATDINIIIITGYDTCPEHSSALPCKPRRNTCVYSAQGGRPELKIIRGRLQKPLRYTVSRLLDNCTSTSFPESSVWLASPSTDTQHLEAQGTDGGRAPNTSSLHPDTLALIFSINSPSGSFIEFPLSCDSSPHYTGGECGHTLGRITDKATVQNCVCPGLWPSPTFCWGIPFSSVFPAGGCSSLAMEELLNHLTKVNILLWLCIIV